MKLGGNLFIKIFIGFWLMTIAILGSWTVTSNYFDSQPQELTQRRHSADTPPHRFVLRTIYNLQNQDKQGLITTVKRASEKHNVDIYLLDSTAADLLGRQVPNTVQQAADQLQSGTRRTRLNTASTRLLAHTVHRQQEGPLRAVFVFTKPRLGILSALGGNPWLRIVLAVLISGAICFVLSRLMTNRLKALRSASRRLANGDLDTRLNVRERGGDETDELARDFNSMAVQLQKRVQAQKRLLSDVSHELRSPLARLRIALALAQEDQDNSATYMLRIEQEAERLEELIAQLLASQMQTIVLDTHIDLVPLLEKLCADANFEGQRDSKRVVLERSIDQAIIESSADLLHKSLENILRNALTHTAEHSAVLVKLDMLDEYCRITVEDHGPGVPEEHLDNIFNAFYRIDTARSRESGGYGLGLAITRRAIEQHHGEVTAENTGTGLKITVSLPLHTIQ